MRSLTRLLNWFNPVPPEYAHLAAAFEIENREMIRRFIAPIFFFSGSVAVLSTPITLLLFNFNLWIFLGLQGSLVVCVWVISWLLYRHKALRYIYPMICSCGLLYWIVINIVLLGTHEVILSSSLTAFIVVICITPLPPRWLLGLLSTCLGLFVGAMGVLARAGDLILIRNVATPVIFSTILFVVHYAHLYRQRWESFLAKQMVESTNKQLTALTNRLQADLALAHTIQQSLLPASVPDWPGIDIAAISRPVQEVGGDFYAYQGVAADHVAVAVGDVSGKGLPAALLMATSVAALEAQFAHTWEPAALLTRLNQALMPYTRATRQNCALCYAELRSGVARVSNAGGITPLLRRHAGPATWLEVGGFPLGVGLGSTLGYAEINCPLAPGDTLIFSSDGLVEATNAVGELFGFDRIVAAVESAPISGAQALLNHLLATMEQFLAGAEPHDDLTIVVLQRSVDQPDPAAQIVAPTS